MTVIGVVCCIARAKKGAEGRGRPRSEDGWAHSHRRLGGDRVEWMGPVSVADRGSDGDPQRTVWRTARCLSMFHSRSLMVARLSKLCLPLASAIWHFTRWSFQYILVHTQV